MPDRVSPMDIPTKVTKEVYSLVFPRFLFQHSLSQNEAARILAHFWPAIEEHFARLHAEKILEERDRLWASEYENSGRSESVVPDALDEAADLLVPGISMERR